ncbi:MAG: aspartyl/glutamyl-tRNA amidotransferase subunit A, partial [Chlamydiia bacterium]|nr:aspartyl/glutamyl-tRNA amidotransferase subunit A [Chlamydiia bacterium]
TNLDEFAMGSSTEHSAYKTSANPWDLNCVPGGSSGGSAAAVAARLCPLSLGSDTGGSIRQPAALCGIVGFKPTYGRNSRFGLVAFGSSLDQIGPFATSVADAALLQAVIGKHCDRDSTSIPSPAQPLNAKIGQSVKGMKVGVPYRLIEDLAEEPRANFNAALEKLQELGMELVEVDLDILKHSVAVYYILANAEASTNLARFDGVRYGVRNPDAKTLDDVYECSKHDGFGEEVKRRIMMGTFVLSAGYQDAYYKKAQKVRTLFIQSYAAAFKACDVVATPVSPFTAWKLGAIKDPLQMYLADIYTISANLAGIPAISVPSGFSPDGLPIGLQLSGPQLGDDTVFQVAHAFEQATGYTSEIPPSFK